MPTEKAQLDKNMGEFFRNLAGFLGDDHLSKQDFVDYFEKVVNMVLDMRKNTDERMSQVTTDLLSTFDKLKGNNDVSVSDLKKELKDLMVVHMDTLKAEHNRKMMEIDEKLSEIKNSEPGKDAYEEIIVGKVLERIKPPEQKQVILKDLDISVITGLEDRLQNLNERIAGIRPRMGMRKVPIIKRYNLTSQVDGSTKTFTLPLDTVDVVGVYGTQFPINFNPGTDWTFAGRTLTLTSEVGAPASGQTLYAIIETLFYG